MPLGEVELAFRVAAGLFVIVAPTLMFLALWRGLEAMRDDELIERARQRADTMEQSPTGSDLSLDPVAVTTAPVASDSPPAEPVVCGTCGATNVSGVTYCRECLDELPDD